MNRRNFLNYFTITGLGLLGFSAPIDAADRTSVLSSFRYSNKKNSTKLVFELNNKPNLNIYMMQNPARIVIDLQKTILWGSAPAIDNSSYLLKKIRSGIQSDNSYRIVLDLKESSSIKDYLLKPNDKNKNYRLVIDLKSSKKILLDKKSKYVKSTKKRSKKKMIIVAIDPGHGGKDPGAVGRLGTKEKDLTLNISKKLYAILKKHPNIRPVMTRNRDIFVSLRQRIRIAHKQKADLFISIHADSFTSSKASGSSVYALSLRGASSEAARTLAKKENAADLLGPVSIKDKDSVVASVLLDLTQTSTIQSSLNVGEKILSNLKKINKIHKKTVQQAGFVVLKSPDIPSVLVETAFLSNRKEEKKLRSGKHQLALANSIKNGIEAYLKNPVLA
ncbi:MAG: N-acetylmuramoyl-L-alanine amidase [Gammaproteobacteria bacterium]|nr:MAG: N-acetylmuramoyl-L-alanine amidase [Gammaproteobacteria bacterium]